MVFRRVVPLVLLLSACAASAGAPRAVAERVPEDGVQPRVAVGPDGSVHLAYLRGDPKAADVVVRHRPSGARAWSAPVTVNSRPGSAVTIGSVRGAQLAVGRGNRLHVVWNGSRNAEPKAREGDPVLYAALPPDSGTPTAQRCLSGDTRHLDGGAAVAADSAGHVFVVWHAAPMDREGEDQRRVYVARSDDDGIHFAPAMPVPEAADGVCGCCGLQAATSGDALLVVYRRATRLVERGMTLLVSRDHGVSWKRQSLDDWAANQCPMSTAAILPTQDGAWLGWEHAGHVRFAPWNPTTGLGAAMDLGGGSKKHPALALDAEGQPVAAWTAGTGWQRGGSAGWARLPALEAVGTMAGVPVWGTVAAYRADDGIHVLY